MIEFVDTDPNEPVRLFLYGDGGNGKSTFGARSDNPIIIAAENGASRLTDKDGKPVKMVRGIQSFADVIETTKRLINDKHDFKTAVFDSATEIERLAHVKIVGPSGKSIITVNKGFGAGHSESDSMHKELLSLIEQLRVNRGMNIIVTGHAQIKPAKDPSASEDYDQFEPKLAKGVSGIWKEYVDAVIFVRIHTLVKSNDEMRARAITDGRRVAITQQTPSCQAKNRFGLPAQMDFTMHFWDDLKPYFVPETADDIRKEMADLCAIVQDDALKIKVLKSIEDAGEDMKKLNNLRNRLREITKGAK